MGSQVHNKGQKAVRDRVKLLADYRNVTKFFKVKPITDLELARLENSLLFRLISDVFDAQPAKLRRKYFDKFHGATNPALRADPSAFRWTFLAARQNHRLVVAFFIALGVQTMGKVNRVIARVKRIISRVKNWKLLRVVRGWRKDVAEKVEDAHGKVVKDAKEKIVESCGALSRVAEVFDDAREKVIDAVDAFKGKAE